MKYYVYTCLVILGFGLSASADAFRISNGGAYKLIGRVGVGDNRGTVCALALSEAAEDIYGRRQLATFSQFKKHQDKWVAGSESFSMQTYGSDQLFGSLQKTDRKGAPKKITISLFQDHRTQLYKAIVHENYIGSNSTGKFTVCENLMLK